jgi:O-antigen/teichoic acid export membrane protein
MILHTIRYFVGQTVARGAVYLYSLSLARLLSVEGFTVFTYFLIFSNIYSRLANYSLNMLLTKYRFDRNLEDKALEIRQEELYRFATVLGLILTSLLIALNSFFSISNLFEISTIQFNLILLSGFFLSVENNLIEYFQSKYMSQKYMYYMLGFTLALSILSGFGYWYLGFSTVLVPIVAYTLSQFLLLIISGAFRFQFHFSKKAIKTYLISGTPICLYGLTSYAARYLEMLVLKNKLAILELASFTFIFRLVEALTLVMAAFAATLTPFIFASLKRGEFQNMEKKKIFNLFLVQIILFAAYSLAVFPFVKLAFPNFQQALMSVPLLYLTICLMLFVSLGQSFVVYYDHLKEMLICSLIGLAAGLGLSIILVPSLGTQGALFSKLIALLVTFVGYLWVIRNEELKLWEMGLTKLLIYSSLAFLFVGFYYTYLLG